MNEGPRQGRRCQPEDCDCEAILAEVRAEMERASR